MVGDGTGDGWVVAVVVAVGGWLGTGATVTVGSLLGLLGVTVGLSSFELSTRQALSAAIRNMQPARYDMGCQSLMWEPR